MVRRVAGLPDRFGAVRTGVTRAEQALKYCSNLATGIEARLWRRQSPPRDLVSGSALDVMRIDELISLDGIGVRIRALSKALLLKELAARAARLVQLNESDILKALSDREKLGSTGVGAGIALPHARVMGIKRSMALVLTLERAIDFDSIDEKPVDIVAMLLLPEDTGSETNSSLACIARRLREAGVADCLRKSRSADDIFRCLIDQASEPARR